MKWFKPAYERRRNKLLEACPPGPLRDYLSVPLPAPETPVEQLPLLAVDLETTGLDPRTDRILSIGFVPIDGSAITLAGAGHMLIRQPLRAGVGDSATIHGITDDDLQTGVPLAEGVGAVLDALQGRCLLAHHSAIEEQFITQACMQLWNQAPVFAVVDTLALHLSIVTHLDDEARPGSLRLAQARSQFNLPRYRAHNALTDALAAAELYLAQVQHLGSRTLHDLRR